jgi:2-phospho-L-lactate guanylyltransferase (CobY/MobA/RfbA family)
VVSGPVLRDVDTAEDLREVALLCPGSQFAALAAKLELV